MLHKSLLFTSGEKYLSCSDHIPHKVVGHGGKANEDRQIGRPEGDAPGDGARKRDAGAQGAEESEDKVCLLYTSFQL